MTPLGAKAPPMVAVIGPVEPGLLSAWLDHYEAHGVTRFHLAFHFPDDTGDDVRSPLHAVLRSHRITPGAISTGPWHEDTNTMLRDAQRAAAGPGWHLLADSDEFHTYPTALPDLLVGGERTGTIGGLMLDRVSSNGELTPCDWSLGLDACYPLGGFLTHRLLRGDPRKIVAAHSSVTVDSGNHRAEGHRPGNRPPVVVHHFKWRSGTAQHLARRARNFTDGTWQARTPAVAAEARRFLTHLDRHGGRIAGEEAGVPLRPVRLGELPPWWAAEAEDIVTTWRPPGDGLTASQV